jgi:hypothetical protein
MGFMIGVLHQTLTAITWMRLRWAGYVARMEEKRNTYKILEGKPHADRCVARRRFVWEGSVFMDR